LNIVASNVPWCTAKGLKTNLKITAEWYLQLMAIWIGGNWGKGIRREVEQHSTGILKTGFSADLRANYLLGYTLTIQYSLILFLNGSPIYSIVLIVNVVYCVRTVHLIYSTFLQFKITWCSKHSKIIKY